MANQTHILNGDALKSQAESWLGGELIVMRECLVDGNEYGDDLNSFFLSRAKFISQYDGYKEEDYFIKTVPEIEKIKSLPKDAEVNLWFEDDVFCQVNLWFCVNLLYNNGITKLWLVRPKNHTQYGFGGLKKEELITLFENRIKLQHQAEIAELWTHFKSKNLNEMTNIGDSLESDYPFITEAITAWIDSLPTEKGPGKPVQILQEIMSELKTNEFGPIFKEFSKRASNYGFGDLQVRRLLDSVK